MAKRAAEQTGPQKAARTSLNGAPRAKVVEDADTEGNMDLDIEGGMEGRVGDDYESEEEVAELGGEEEGESMEEVKEEEEGEEKDGKSGKQQIYVPGKSRPLEPGEVLEPDPTTYEMYHKVNMPWPCMSVDILEDKLGSERRSYPATMYVVTATQAMRPKDNELLVLKLSSLRKTLEKDEDEQDSDGDSDEDDDFSGDPILESEAIALRSTTNRIRTNALTAKSDRYYTATMHENGEVCIFDVGAQMRAFDTPGFVIPKAAKRPQQVVKAHGNVEGYGMDWSPLERDGMLLTGDVSGRVYLTRNTGSKWTTDRDEFQASDASIEDIQWSKSERTVFSTGGVDGCIRIWDTRAKKHTPALSIVASKSDVNVISWCEKIDYLLASGHDDGVWGVWDLRNFRPNQQPSPVVSYDFHKKPITAISFDPLDESIVAVASEDNTVTLWDLAVEADDEEVRQQQAGNDQLRDIPPQMLFGHWQRDVKDVCWHRQIPGTLLSTGSDGMNVWKTISV